MNESPRTCLSLDEVAQLVTVIRQRIDAMKSGDTTVSAAVELEQYFERLREEARQRSTAVHSHMASLKQLRQEFDDQAYRISAALVDRLHELKESMKAKEAEHEYLRSILVKLCSAKSVTRFDGRAAQAVINVTIRRALPPAGTAQRTEVEELVHRLGIWSKVSQLSSTKLSGVLTSHELSDADHAQLDQLCPPTTVHSLRVKATTRP